MNLRFKQWFLPTILVLTIGFLIYFVFDPSIWILPKASDLEHRVGLFYVAIIAAIITTALIFLFQIESLAWYKKYIYDRSTEKLKLGYPMMVTIRSLLLAVIVATGIGDNYGIYGIILSILLIGVGGSFVAWSRYISQQKEIRDAKARAPESKLDKESVEKI